MSKIEIYIRENLLGAARQAGISVGSGLLRKGLYGLSVGQGLPIAVYDGYSDRLMVDGVDAVNGIVLEADGSRIAFMNALVDVEKNNDVKDTPLVARAGTVKERIQEQDYNITVTGDLFGERDKFPYYELQLLNFILSSAKGISVASAYLCIFDIERLVLKKPNFDQSKLRHFNVMPFTLKFVSDMDYDFLVDDN